MTAGKIGTVNDTGKERQNMLTGVTERHRRQSAINLIKITEGRFLWKSMVAGVALHGT